jgi:glyoxylase-like metal-dependent hydrolase (beta-lactamase superfamily II)
MWQDETSRRLRAGSTASASTSARHHAARDAHPGHASNHLCYLLEEEKTLFTGDHVMQGSTVVINPPDGDMAAYLAGAAGAARRGPGVAGAGPRLPGGQPQGRAARADRAPPAARGQGAGRCTAAAGALRLEALLPEVYDDVPAALHPVARARCWRTCSSCRPTARAP